MEPVESDYYTQLADILTKERAGAPRGGSVISSGYYIRIAASLPVPDVTPMSEVADDSVRD